jgi:hypothetical protein
VCIRTLNVLSYFGLCSAMISQKFRKSVVVKVQKHQREEQDVFSIFYRCNTRKNIKRMMMKYGFEGTVYGYESEPRYLDFNGFFYFLGVLHQKFAPPLFKLAIFAFGEKI